MTAGFVRTGTVLDRMLDNAAQAVAVRRAHKSMGEIIGAASLAAPPRDMLGALIPVLDPLPMLGERVWGSDVALIAEFHHASPSKGALVEPLDPVAIARIYEQNGAAAISVLTDEDYSGTWIAWPRSGKWRRCHC